MMGLRAQPSTRCCISDAIAKVRHFATALVNSGGLWGDKVK